MKNIYLIFCFVLLTYFKTNAQTFSSNCTITPSIANLYKTDVTRMCIARLNETNNPYKDSIEIPQDVYDTIMRAFVLMHNMQNSSIKDTIKNLFQFENYTSISISTASRDVSYENDSTHISLVATGVFGVSNRDGTKPQIFEVHIDSNILWAKDWANGNITNTSYPLMNQFIQQYDFSITKLPYTFFGQYFFNLKTEVLKNINALSKAIPSYSSFAYVQPLAYFGDGNIINFEFKNGGILATYHNGCGDCVAGCTYWEDWQFFIPYDSCNVNYMGLVNVRPNLLTGEVGCLRGTLITPIAFGSITANKQGNNNQINFTTLTEVNIKNYQIERSSNAKDFVTINILAANNKNNSSYAIVDRNPLSGNNYYRVKVIENNGIISYSKTVLVKNEDIIIGMYPNPTKGLVHILIPRESKGVWSIKVQDVLGRVLQEQTTTALTKSMDMVVSQQKGFYYVTMVNKTTNKKIVEKIVVE